MEERSIPKVAAVTGPTASGKTALAIALAQRLNGEIVSCDSMQIYRGMDIGTAKPTPEELSAVPHHMINIVEPQEEYSCARYAREAGDVIRDIIARKVPHPVRRHRTVSGQRACGRASQRAAGGSRTAGAFAAEVSGGTVCHADQGRSRVRRGDPSEQ